MINARRFISVGLSSIFLIVACCLHISLAQSEPASMTGNVLTSSPGQKISLDIKGMDIIDVLKMLSTRSGANIVVGKNVTGRVTLFLKDVDINDAFDIILIANDLAYEKKGDIINVMTQRDYELIYGDRFQDKKEVKVIQLKFAKAADLSRALVQIKTNLGRIVTDDNSNTIVLIDTPQKVAEMQDFIEKTDLPLETKIFNLNYAQSDKLMPKIQEAITKGVGSIKIDERTNKIAITDYPEKVKDIAKIITAFDDRSQQVLIDAQIIELTPSDKFEMGVDFNFWIEKYFQVAAKLPINTDNTLLIGTKNVDPDHPGHYKAVIDILRTIGDTKILSSPRIMTLNNQEAKILVGTKDAYITSTISQSGTGTAITAQEVNFVDTGIKLSVTPIISREKFVTMKIKPEISSAEAKLITADDKKTEIPIVTTSEAETTIMVKDGVTVIIGGLKKDQRVKTVKKIPVLGDIPLLGYLFRSTSDNLTKTELVILLTPHIMTGETTFSDFDQITPKDGTRFKMVNGNIVNERISAPESQLNQNSYFSLVVNKVTSLALLNKPAGLKGEVKLGFTLAKSGKLLEGPYIIGTNNNNLNSYAIKSITAASPFPPFPNGLEKDKENFKVILSYE